MTKLREPLTIEHILSEVLKKINTEELKQITGKSISHFRKCSDPDLDQQLDHRDAVKIDRACIENGLTPYLLRAHEYIILKELENSKAQNHDVNELLVKFTILHGELMSAINKARNPAGEKGNLISAAEKKEIFDAFHALENKILKIKTTIEKN